MYATNLTNLLVLTNKGKCYWQKVYLIPQATRTAKGRSISNLIKLNSNESVQAILPVDSFDQEAYIVMITKKGIIKKTAISAFSKPRPSGIVALKIDLDDQVISAKISKNKDDIFIGTKLGQSIRFSEAKVRSMGRSARGVKGIQLSKGDEVISMEVLRKGSKQTILMLTQKGYGKRTAFYEYRMQGRGGSGIITQRVNSKIGSVISSMCVGDNNNIVITTNKGQSIRVKVSDVPKLGRNTQGVRLINLKSDESVIGLALIHEEEQS